MKMQTPAMKVLALSALLSGGASAFSPVRSGPGLARSSPFPSSAAVTPATSATALFSSNGDDPALAEKFGGYTVKQRLREEVESPFRTLRLFFFGSSTGSALTALYFSLLSAVKANAGPGVYPDAPTLEEALTNCAINLGAAVVCGLLTYRDWRAGEANLKRIAQGGALARLVVSPAGEGGAARTTLKEYRRNARVIIAAGGRSYIEELCLSLNADQLADENTLAQSLADVDVVVIPVLLEGNDGQTVGDTKSAWVNSAPSESDRNFDPTRSDPVIAFPVSPSSWAEYLSPEVETAQGQGFDVLEKGFTITVKKNGRILRRATGLPQWANMIGTMEVMDGSRFGMPGDTEKYGGP